MDPQRWLISPLTTNWHLFGSGISPTHWSRSPPTRKRSAQVPEHAPVTFLKVSSSDLLRSAYLATSDPGKRNRGGLTRRVSSGANGPGANRWCLACEDRREEHGVYMSGAPVVHPQKSKGTPVPPSKRRYDWSPIGYSVDVYLPETPQNDAGSEQVPLEDFEARFDRADVVLFSNGFTARRRVHLLGPIESGREV